MAPVVLGWLYERLYHELAWAYDPVSLLVSGGRWRAWSRAAIPFVLGARVLDVGCGTGNLVADLCRQGFQATGVDLSGAMLRRAEMNLARAGYLGRLIRADARCLPFRADSFDSVTLTFPTPVIRDPALWLELARILRPGGRVVVVLGARSVGRRAGTFVDLAGKLTGRFVAKSGSSADHAAARDLNLPEPAETFQTRMVKVEEDRSVVTLVIATKSSYP